MKQSRFSILSDEKCLKIENWVNQYGITRFLTSFVALAFFYGTFLFFYEIKFLRELIPVVHPFLIAWAAGLAAYNLFVRKLYFKLPFYKILLLFLVSAGLTAIITIEAGLVGNIKTWILVALPLFAFYPVCLSTEKGKATKSFVLATLGANVVVFLASFTAVVMYFMCFSETITFLGIEETIGFRYYIPGDPESAIILYGAYVDTNHAAVYSIIFAALSAVLFIFCKKGLFSKPWKNKVGKTFAIINFFVQLIYFPLANSRGGWLSLIIALSVTLFFLFNCKILKIKKQALKAVLAVVLSALCVTGTYYGLVGLRFVTSNAVVYTEKAAQYIQNLFASGGSGSNNKVEHEIPSIDKFEKADDGSGAGRLDIWKETVGLYVKRPIFGVGPGNTGYYGTKYDIPGKKIKIGADVHNSYLDLLAEYGIVGFALMAVFWLLCLKGIVKEFIKKGKEKGTAFYICAFILLFISGGSAFLSCVFINTTAMYFMMLVMVGYLLTQIELKGCAKDGTKK